MFMGTVKVFLSYFFGALKGIRRYSFQPLQKETHNYRMLKYDRKGTTVIKEGNKFPFFFKNSLQYLTYA